MLKRKIMEDLIKWKNKTDKKCLLIEGARQTGKTFIINTFLNNEYKSADVISIDFLREPQYNRYFEVSLDPNYLIEMIKVEQLGKGKSLIPEKTIIFFDEIQACPNAITSLKYFYQDSKYSVIASGSLLEIGYQRVKSFPVGAVERLTLHPLDFEEFLWAMDVDVKYIELIKDCFERRIPVMDDLHDKMNVLFDKYLWIGGMPSPINAYLKYGDMEEVYLRQKDILNDYRNDIINYRISKTIGNKTRECFDSIALQLSKSNKKFMYSAIKHGGRSIEYDACINWLIDAGIVIKVNNLNSLTNEVIMDSFKIYMNDWSILIPLMDEASREALYKGELTVCNGGVYENIIASTLRFKNYKLFYYNPNENIENEFIYSKKDGIYILEVKAGSHTKSTSFNNSLKKSNYIGIKISKTMLGIMEYS